ncbi:MAG TPA: 2Fe-2S iron-sulfur cluster-binding protein, partial [Clostridia bacterium]
MDMIINANGETIRTQAEREIRLLDVIRRFDIPFPAPCGGHGNCGGCLVSIRGAGQVLACRTSVGDVLRMTGGQQEIILDLPDAATAKILTDARGVSLAIDPMIVREDIVLPMPTLADQRPDAERFQDVTGHMLSFETLRKLPRRMREDRGRISCVVRRDTGEVVDLIGKSSTGPYGIALDIGTTTLVAYLYHLGTGQLLGHRAMTNPQGVFGADVISRIGAASGSRRDQSTMKERICTAIRELASALAADAIRRGEDVQIDEIKLYMAAGNTTMLHLLADIDPDAIARAPFIPAFTSGIVLPAMTLGLTPAGGALCALLPSVSAYVGADVVCGILACGMNMDNGKNRLLIDIGTNGEIALAAGNRLIA